MVSLWLASVEQHADPKYGFNTLVQVSINDLIITRLCKENLSL